MQDSALLTVGCVKLFSASECHSSECHARLSNFVLSQAVLGPDDEDVAESLADLAVHTHHKCFDGICTSNVLRMLLCLLNSVASAEFDGAVSARLRMGLA